LDKKKFYLPTSGVKEQIVGDFLGKGLTLSLLIIKNNVSRTALESWIHKVRKAGYSTLYQQTYRGNHQKNM